MSNVGYATLQIIPSLQGAGAAITKGVVPQSSKAGDAAGEGFSKGFTGKATGLIGAGLKLGGLAAGAALVSGLLEAAGQKDIAAGMQASMGLTPEVSSKFGAAAGLAYKQNYGESVAQVGDTIKAAFQNGIVAADDSKEAIAGVVAQVETYAQVSGEDAVNSTRAVGQMIKTGLAKNATEAFDILTRGQQLGLNNNEDLIDTFNEYSVQFDKLGIGGPQALGLINQAMKAGARDSDVAADAIKEFAIRATDGSATSAAGFKALGLNAKEMTETFAAGGPKANAALQVVFDRLKSIKDPAKQSAAAVALFGTQAEDLGQALFAMDPASAAKGLGQVAGATERANKALGSTPGAQIASFTRTLKQGFVEVLGGQVLPNLLKAGGALKADFGPAITDLVSHIRDAGPGLISMGQAFINGIVPGIQAAVTVISKIIGFMSEHTTLVKAAAIALGTLVVVTNIYNAALAVQAAGGMVAFIKNLGIVTKLTRSYTAVQAALNLVMSLNPIGLVVIAIAALVAGLIYAWKHSETFRNVVLAVWGAVKGFVLGAASAVKNAVVTAWNAIKAATSATWNAIKAAISAVWNFIKGYVTGQVNLVKAVVSGAWNGIKAVTSAVWNAIKAAVSAAVGALVGAVRAQVNLTKSIVSGAWNAVKSVTTSAWNGIKGAVSTAISGVVSIVSGIKGRVTGALGNLGGVLVNAGKNLIQGLISGIDNALGGLKSKLQSVTNIIPDWKGPIDTDRELLTPAGEAIIGSLITGMEGQLPALRKFLGHVSTSIAGGLTASPSIAMTARGLAGAAHLTNATGIGARGNGSSQRPVNITVAADDPDATARKVGRHLANQGV